VRRAPFGRAPDGAPVELFTLTSAACGIEVRVATYGGIIVSLRVPGRDGAADVVLGHDDIEGYGRSASYFGAIVGRYANRIAGGRFTLDGETHRLTRNDGANHLHGGTRGFDKAVWRAEPFARAGACGVALAHTSPDGDQGYPGTLEARATYTLGDDGRLTVEYRGTTDRATPVSLSQHSYWNLAGAGSGSVLDHDLTIHADHFTPVDGALIPTGVIAEVAGTPFDFRAPMRVGARIREPDVQLRRGHGYDHNFVLRRDDGAGLAPAARLRDPASGRVMEVWTTEPGVQLYTGNRIAAETRGKEGRSYGPHAALCLETQHFPDSPNHPDFSSTILRPGEEYVSRTEYRFGTDAGTGGTGGGVSV
jgi:aldose 1-epimerase